MTDSVAHAASAKTLMVSGQSCAIGFLTKHSKGAKVNRNEFLKTVGLSAFAALLAAPQIAKSVSSQVDETDLVKPQKSRKLYAIADTDLISSRYMPMRFQRKPTERIEAGSLCLICVCDEPRVYKLDRFDLPVEFWTYRIAETPPLGVEILEIYKVAGQVIIYTTAALYEKRAAWWRSQNNNAAAQVDRNFIKLLKAS